MLCYHDKTFCTASGTTCRNTECWRFASEEEKANANRIGLPMCWGNLSSRCGQVVPMPHAWAERTLKSWQKKIIGWLERHAPNDDDGAHDISHLLRVWHTARKLATEEYADQLVVLAASLMHDCVNVPKSDKERRPLASRMSADMAIPALEELRVPKALLGDVRHAIEAHSFSAGITPTTPEARVVQDADRIDSLGAIGIARCFTVSGQIKRPICHSDDPLGEDRDLDDYAYTLDHFGMKLLKLPEMMTTRSGRFMAQQRVAYMEEFQERLAAEIAGQA